MDNNPRQDYIGMFLIPLGLTGNEKLVEIGGPPYLLPLVQRNKLYDLALLAKHLQRDPVFLAGAGAGPWPHVGVNCEVRRCVFLSLLLLAGWLSKIQLRFFLSR